MDKSKKLDPKHPIAGWARKRLSVEEYFQLVEEPEQRKANA